MAFDLAQAERRGRFQPPSLTHARSSASCSPIPFGLGEVESQGNTSPFPTPHRPETKKGGLRRDRPNSSST